MQKKVKGLKKHQLFIVAFLWCFFLAPANKVAAQVHPELCRQVLPNAQALSLNNQLTANDNEFPVEYKVISSGAQALAARVAMIRQAQKSIDLVYYIFKKDFSGKIILNELKKAVEKGVTVRILLDGIGSTSAEHFVFRDHFESLVGYAQQHHIRGKLEVNYAHSVLNLKNVLSKSVYRFVKQIFQQKGQREILSLNQRIHDKILITDAQLPTALVLIGGRNVGKEYFDLQDNRRGNMVDLDILMRPISFNSNQSQSLSDSFLHYFEMLMYDTPSRSLFGKIFGVLPNFYYQQDLNNLNGLDQNHRMKKIESWVADLNTEEFLNEGFTESIGTIVSEYANLVANNSVSRARWFEDNQESSKQSSQGLKAALQSYGEKIRNSSLLSGDWLPLKNKKLRQSSIWRSLKRRMNLAQEIIEIFTPYPIFADIDLRLAERLLKSNLQLNIHLHTSSKETTDHAIVQIYFDTYIMPKITKLNADPIINGRIKVFRFNEITAENIRYVFNHTKLVRIDKKEVLVATSNFDSRSNKVNSESGIFLLDLNDDENFSDHINFIASSSTEVSLDQVHQEIQSLPLWKRKFYEYTESFLIKIGLFRQL